MRAESGRPQRGAASIEYTIVTFAVIVALFTPVAGGESLVEMVMQALRDFQANTTYLLSLP